MTLPWDPVLRDFSVCRRQAPLADSLCEGGEGAATAEEPLEQLAERADDAPAEHLVRRRREELRRPARGRRREGGEPRK